MTSRSLTVFALGISLAAPPAMIATAQTPADASSTNAAPAAPAPAPAMATPAPTAAPAPADTSMTPATTDERPTTYTMVAGDTLDSIAHKFNTSIRALAKLNKIHKSEYRKLRAGKVLQIPPANPDAATNK